MSNPTFVQYADHNFNNGSGAPNESVAFSSHNTAGNLLVCVTGSSTNGSSTIQDSLGNVWTALSASPLSYGLDFLRAYYCLNCKAGANTVQCNYAGTGTGTYVDIAIAEYSGVDSIGNHGETSGNSGTPTGPSEIPPAFQGIVLGYADGGSNAVWAPTGPFTQRTASTGFRTALEDVVNSVVTPYAAGFTTGSGAWGAGTAIFYNSQLPLRAPFVSDIQTGSSANIARKRASIRTITAGPMSDPEI